MRKLLWSLLLAGCDDASPSSEVDAAAGSGGRPGLRDATAPDANPDATPPPPDAGRVADMRADECNLGQRECLVEGEPAFRTCVEGQWGVDTCGADEVCVGVEGTCLPDPATCAPGQRACLEGAPAECSPRGWRPLEPCAGDTTCSGDGDCRHAACAAAEQRRSYLGCDYLATDLPNAYKQPLGGSTNAPVGVVLANPDPDHVVHVWARDVDGDIAPLVGELPVDVPFNVAAQYAPVTVRSQRFDAAGAVVESGFTRAEGLELPPGGMVVLLFAHHGYVASSKVAPHSWRITTDAPVVATQFSPYCCNYSFSNDASLLLPTSALGTEHLIVGVPAWSTGEGDTFQWRPATLTVIAAESMTDVTITLPEDMRLMDDSSRRTQRNGDVITLRMGRGEVLHLLTAQPDPMGDFARAGEDFSGARVDANRPLAVFTGHECTFYPMHLEACDHLEEQITPVDTWGEHYVLTPPVKRSDDPASQEAVYWKLIAERDDTAITFSVPYHELRPLQPGAPGVPPCEDFLEDAVRIRLDAGEFCELGTDTAFEVQASGPIAALGIVSGQASTGARPGFGSHAGDPSIFLAPPVSQLRTFYEILAPTTFFRDTVTVFAPADTRVDIDGVPIDMAGATPVGGSEWVVRHVDISDGPHAIRGSRPFGLLVFAYDDYVSYAFTGGLNLEKRPPP